MKRVFQILFILLFSGLIIGQVYSEQEEAKSNKKFSHKLHVGEMQVTCSVCHENVFKSLSGRDNNIPNEEPCQECHDQGIGEIIRLSNKITDYIEKFPHQVHLKSESEEVCSTCHKNVAEADSIISIEYLPHMIDCNNCHEVSEKMNLATREVSQTREAGAHNISKIPENCGLCHEDKFKPRPKDHVDDWINVHRNSKKSNDTTCDTCHLEQQCQECHYGDVVTRNNHPLNWEFSHSIAAKSHLLECQSCHEDVEFCSSCHQSNYVLPANHSSAIWVNQQDGGRHGKTALIDLNYCVVCHGSDTSDPICLECHHE